MLSWTIKEIDTPLKFVWKIARGSKTTSKSFIIDLSDGDINGLGEISPNARYGETREVILESFKRFVDIFPEEIGSVEELIRFLHEEDFPASFCFGIESAFVHYLSKLVEKPVSEVLSVRTVNSVSTSFSIPIITPGEVSDFINKYKLQRFNSIKLKVDAESGADLVKAVHQNFDGMIRIDANEAWSDPEEVLKFIESLKGLPIEFLEQPLQASCHNEALYLKEKSPLTLIADESLTNADVTQYHADRFHGVNVKLMKAGGYMKAIKQLRSAKAFGMKTMLGCMVETSLGISSAMHIAHGVDYIDLDGSLFLESDPFNLITEESGKLFFAHLQ